MFEKTEEDFKLLSFSDWIWHHYMSGDSTKEDAQLGLATSILESEHGNGVKACDTWARIDREMDGLPWVVHPENLTRAEYEEQPLDTWVKHFFTSGQQDIELEWQTIAEMRIASNGESFETWQQIIKECNYAESQWKRSLQTRQQGRCEEDRAPNRTRSITWPLLQ